MKHSLPIFLLLASAQLVFAQIPQPPRVLCGNELLHHIAREHYPEWQAAFDQTFEQAARHTEAVADRAPLTVNVVVHVVWNAATENLPDSVIENQMRVLNEDFNRMNADTGRLRSLFRPVLGNAEIRFQLAEIVRVKTTKLFSIDVLGGKLMPEVKQNNLGGSDARDPEKFLNIWVCKIQPTTIFGFPVGQVFGFAFPPAGLSHWPAGASAPTPGEDGVVMDFRMVGRNNPNPAADPVTGDPLVVRGRTATHEVAHYLGLRHIWGDGGLLGPNDCAQSDGVDDTPFANAQSNFDCDTTRNTCKQVEMFYNEDVPDLVENFMDYSGETCMSMFTKGQVQLTRKGLLAASSVAAPGRHEALPLHIAPNPAGERTAVSFVLPEKTEVTARVVSASGQALLELAPQTFEAGPQRLELDTQGLPAGVFFVEIRTTAGRFVGRVGKK
jgi:hypothetical protein